MLVKVGAPDIRISAELLLLQVDMQVANLVSMSAPSQHHSKMQTLEIKMGDHLRQK